MLKGTPEDRVLALEQAMLEGLSQPSYQTYLDGAGLDESSVAGSEIWDAQIDAMYDQARAAMIELGIIDN